MTTRRGCVALLVMGGLGSVAWSQTTLDWPTGEYRDYHVDSGVRQNPAGEAVTVFDHTVRVENAAWLRLYFGAVSLPEGSFVRITSRLDHEVQDLDAGALAAWSNTSAYFNGDAVRVELVAGPRTAGARVAIDRIATAEAVQPEGGSGQCGICGADDRVSSSELWTARLLPLGCTASVYNDQSCMVTAGHCVDGSVGDVVQFNVPASLSNCQIVNPPVEDQFPIVFKQYVNGGVGNDWGALSAGTNNLGQKPYDRYGQLMPLAAAPAQVGQAASVTGYGVDLTCVLSQTQQTDDGSITSVFSTFYEYDIDVRGGNSGSALVVDGAIAGVVTHCPCPNVATRIDLPAFVQGREIACCPNPPKLSDCCLANGTPGCDDPSCESTVCAVDPFCCDVSWDSICAGEASDLCGDLCQASCEDAPCPWDLDGSGDVGILDFLELLAAWGTDPGGPPDFNGDGTVGILDFLELLSNWGPCP